MLKKDQQWIHKNTTNKQAAMWKFDRIINPTLGLNNSSVPTANEYNECQNNENV